MKTKQCQRGQNCDRPKTGRCRKKATWKSPAGLDKIYYWCDEHRNYYDVRIPIMFGGTVSTKKYKKPQPLPAHNWQRL